MFIGHFNGEDWNKHRGMTTHMPDLSHRPNTFAFAWQQNDDGHGGFMVWYINNQPVMKADIPLGTRRMSDWQVIINVAMGGNVNQGAVPADGTYDFVIHSLMLADGPVGGWDRFHHDFQATVEGKTM